MKKTWKSFYKKIPVEQKYADMTLVEMNSVKLMTQVKHTETENI